MLFFAKCTRRGKKTRAGLGKDVRRGVREGQKGRKKNKDLAPEGAGEDAGADISILDVRRFSKKIHRTCGSAVS